MNDKDTDTVIYSESKKLIHSIKNTINEYIKESIYADAIDANIIINALLTCLGAHILAATSKSKIDEVLVELNEKLKENIHAYIEQCGDLLND